MELQFDGTGIRALQTAACAVKTAELTQEIKLPDGMPDIGRVLTAWGQVMLRSKQWDRNLISVSGGVMVHTLYVPEDGTEVRSVEGWLPFQLEWDAGEGDREGPVQILPLLRFVDSRGISARKIMVRVGVSALGQAFRPEEVVVFGPPEVPEDVQLLRRTYPVRIPREAGERTFLLDEEPELPASAPAVDKILAVTMNPEVTSVKVMDDKLVFKGNGRVHMVYRCPEGMVRTADFRLPFSQFAELDSTMGPSAEGQVRLAVTSLETDAQEAGKLRVKAGLVGQYLVDEELPLELTEDAYSPVREVTVVPGELRIPTVLDSRLESVTAEQKLPGKTGQVLDVVFFPDFPKQRRNGEATELELGGQFQLLYQQEDGALQGAGIRWDGSMTIPGDENIRILPQVIPAGEPAAHMATDGVLLSGVMELDLRTESNGGLPMISALQLGQIREPDPERPSLILMRPGHRDLWDLAKACGSTVDAIRSANGLEAEPDENAMLLIPVT